MAVAQHRAEAGQPFVRAISGIWVALRVNWQIAGVLAAFAAAAFVVPTMTPVATTDDWGYTRSVEILLDEGELTVFPVVAATAVFQIGWGALFGLTFGMSLGVMRIATLVMVILGGFALYALLRELNVPRGRSALGVAAYLFNPLAFILAYTFMTDPYFTSLLIIATFLYLRGLQSDSERAILAGSTVAACAFLTRQQGALIPLAVITYLVLTQRMRLNRTGINLLMRVGAIPVIAMAAYCIWLTQFNGVPETQTGFLDEARAEGLGGTRELTRHLTYIELMYLGFFAAPIVIALIPAMRQLLRGIRTSGWLLFCIWEGVLLAGLSSYWVEGRRWPYVPQFMGSGGLGPPDVIGSRPRLFERQFFDWATVVCAVSAVMLALVLCRAVRAAPDRAGIGLVLSITVWQVAGILPPSFHYLDGAYSLDRYLLPLLPLVLCLALWASRDLRFFAPLGWAAVVVLAVFSIAGTRDYLVFMDAVWDTARDANKAGVANEHLDAGSGWDGYHLYTYGLDHGITKARTPKAPWWVYYYAKATDSDYVIATKPRRGYAIEWKRPYSSWLERDPTFVYLLRRYGERPLP